MKKITLSVVMMMVLIGSVYSQSPEAINYQAVARDAGGNLLSNQLVSFQLSILQGSPSGTAVYVESHQKTINQFGLATLEIGRGTVVSGNFSTIAWGNDSYYLQTEMDPTGGTSYSLMGTSQFLSVPYAQYAKTAGNGFGAGTSGQTIRNNGTSWVPDDNLFNDGTKIGIGTNVPDNAAMLEVKSTTKGFLAPRMTMAQRDFITTPATGLLVYQTDNTPGYYYYTGSAWLKLGTGSGTVTNVSGTAPVTSSGGTAPVISLPAATASAHGYMTSAYAAKLDGIAAGANNYIHPTGDGNLHVIATGTTNNGKVLSAGATAGSLSWKNVGTVTNVTGTSPIISSGGPTPVISISAATHSAAGSMSAADKTKLDDIAAGANNYIHPTGDGNLHVIATGTTNNGKVLTAGATAGSLSWKNVGTVTNVTGTSPIVSSGGPTPVISISAATPSAAGSMSAADKTKLDGTTHTIGESYGGGIVFYVYDGGRHGLIAATADQATGIRWYGGSTTNTRARADGVGAGLKNTSIIVANQGPVDGNAFAATVCNEYSVTVGGVTYGDWYLPSKYELNLLYLQKTVVGGFANYYYWSSSEFDANGAWYQNFVDGFQGISNKNFTYYVRAVRTF